MNARRDITGQRFGRLVVIAYSRQVYRSGAAWLCRCDCGAEKEIRGHNLRSGSTVSCGCHRLAARPTLTHGHAGRVNGKLASPTYRAWSSMLTRVRGSPDSFRNYKGRGITVCGRWLRFENFLADMGERPPGTTIDRINNAGHYEPGNCRWATLREQARNKRNNRMIAALGQVKTLQEWADSVRITPSALSQRFVRGWPAERAVSEPPLPNVRLANRHNGEK